MGQCFIPFLLADIFHFMDISYFVVFSIHPLLGILDYFYHLALLWAVLLLDAYKFCLSTCFQVLGYILGGEWWVPGDSEEDLPHCFPFPMIDSTYSDVVITLTCRCPGAEFPHQVHLCECYEEMLEISVCLWH